MFGFPRSAVVPVLAALVAADAPARADDPAPGSTPTPPPFEDAIALGATVPERLAEARRLIERGQPEAALWLLRWTREMAAAETDPKRRAANLAGLGALTFRAVETRRERDARAALEKAVAARGDELARAADALDTEAARHARLLHEFDRAIAPQLAPGGGGGGGGAGGGGGGGGGIATGGGGFGFVGPGGVYGAAAFPAPLATGAFLSVTPVVSADRRYVRLAMSPAFVSNPSFASFTVFRLQPGRRRRRRRRRPLTAIAAGAPPGRDRRDPSDPSTDRFRLARFLTPRRVRRRGRAARVPESRRSSRRPPCGSSVPGRAKTAPSAARAGGGRPPSHARGPRPAPRRAGT